MTALDDFEANSPIQTVYVVLFPHANSAFFELRASAVRAAREYNEDHADPARIQSFPVNTNGLVTIPASYLPIDSPSAYDIRIERVHQMRQLAIEHARELGLTSDEIDLIANDPYKELD